jgi:hypothetical protein
VRLDDPRAGRVVLEGEDVGGAAADDGAGPAPPPHDPNAYLVDAAASPSPLEVTAAQSSDFPALAALNVAAYGEFRPLVGEETWEGMRAGLEAVAALAEAAELLGVRDGGTHPRRRRLPGRRAHGTAAPARVDEVLVPLHEVHPLRGVRFGG